MIRYSSINRLLKQSRYIIDHKKPKTQIPTNKPPKYVYQYKYHPNVDPGIDRGYPDHHHLNPFVQLGASKYEQFRFSYVGEWWENHFAYKAFLFYAPVMLFVVLSYMWYDNTKKNAPNRANVQNFDHIFSVNCQPRDMR